MAPKLLLDEHLSPSVAHRLTALSFDVTCVRDRGLAGFQDWELLAWCVKEGRAICTQDDEDFEKEHLKFVNRGDIHFGIVTVGEWDAGQLFSALLVFLGATEDHMLLNRFISLEEP